MGQAKPSAGPFQNAAWPLTMATRPMALTARQARTPHGRGPSERVSYHHVDMAKVYAYGHLRAIDGK